MFFLQSHVHNFIVVGRAFTRSLLHYFVTLCYFVVFQKVSHEVCDDYGYGAHSYHHGYHDRSDTDSDQ